jgi:hypothetical protein
MPDAAPRPLTAEDVEQRLLADVAEARAQLAEVTAGRDKLEDDYEELQQLLDAWPECPDCGCRLNTGDADAQECGCTGPCTMECRENGYPDAPSYRDLAVAEVTAERDEARELAARVRAVIARYKDDQVNPITAFADIMDAAGEGQ